MGKKAKVFCHFSLSFAILLSESALS